MAKPEYGYYVDHSYSGKLPTLEYPVEEEGWNHWVYAANWCLSIGPEGSNLLEIYAIRSPLDSPGVGVTYRRIRMRYYENTGEITWENLPPAP